MNKENIKKFRCIDSILRMKTTKLICIEVFDVPCITTQLTLNEVYVGRKDSYEGWYIELNKGRFLWYPNRCFMYLHDWRNQQIDSILDD